MDFDQRGERGQRVDGTEIGEGARREDGDLYGAVGLQRGEEGGLGRVIVAQGDELIETTTRLGREEIEELVAHLRCGQQKSLFRDV